MLLPGKFHGWRSLEGYTWGCKELDMTEQLTNTIPAILILVPNHYGWLQVSVFFHLLFFYFIPSGIVKPHLNQLYSNKCSVLIQFWSYLHRGWSIRLGKRQNYFNCLHFNDDKLQMDSSWNEMIMKLLPSPCTFTVLKHPIPSLQTSLSPYNINLCLTEKNKSKEKCKNLKRSTPISQDPQ